MTTKIEFSTVEYQISHGKTPRGRGTWAFGLSRKSTGDNVFFANGTLAEAKKAARAHFVEALNMANPTLPCAMVYVLP